MSEGNRKDENSELKESKDKTSIVENIEKSTDEAADSNQTQTDKSAETANENITKPIDNEQSDGQNKSEKLETVEKSNDAKELSSEKIIDQEPEKISDQEPVNEKQSNGTDEVQNEETEAEINLTLEYDDVEDQLLNDTQTEDNTIIETEKEKENEKSKNEKDVKPDDKKETDSIKTDDKNKENNDQVIADKQQSQVSSSRCFWVSGLSHSIRANDLKHHFASQGRVIGAKVVSNSRSANPRFYGYVVMSTPEEADACIKNLHNSKLLNRFITVQRSKPFKERQNDENNSGSTDSVAKSQKREIEDQLKEKSSSGYSSKPKKEDAKKDETKHPSSTNPNSKLESEKDKRDDTSKKSRSDSEKDRNSRERKRPRESSRERNDKKHSRERSRERENKDKRTERDRERERERERERYERMREEREKEKLQREERRIREMQRRQREEADRLERERRLIQIEKERLEREKMELLRLEKEQLEKEREELKRQKRKIEEAARRKYESSDRDRHRRERSRSRERKRDRSPGRRSPDIPPKMVKKHEPERYKGPERRRDSVEKAKDRTPKDTRVSKESYRNDHKDRRDYEYGRSTDPPKYDRYHEERKFTPSKSRNTEMPPGESDFVKSSSYGSKRGDIMMEPPPPRISVAEANRFNVPSISRAMYDGSDGDRMREEGPPPGRVLDRVSDRFPAERHGRLSNDNMESVHRSRPPYPPGVDDRITVSARVDRPDSSRITRAERRPDSGPPHPNTEPRFHEERDFRHREWYPEKRFMQPVGNPPRDDPWSRSGHGNSGPHNWESARHYDHSIRPPGVYPNNFERNMKLERH